MNRKPHSIWRTTTAAVSAVLLSAALPIAPIAADAQPEDRGQDPGLPPVDPAPPSMSSTAGSSPSGGIRCLRGRTGAKASTIHLT